MKKIIFLSIASIAMLMLFVQCKPNNEKQEAAKETANPNLHKVTVKEIQNANAYTYLLVTENEKDFWIAIPKTEVKVGKTYIYEGGVEMKQYESKDLKRTFDSVFFVEGLVDPDAPAVTEEVTKPTVDTTITKTDLSKGITLAKGAISIHDLYQNKDKLAGKTIILTGKVVKFLPQIMKKNWIHLQDGSIYKGIDDVTITSLSDVKVDEIVTLKGTVVLNKDLGSGYKYSILIEDAVIVK